MQPNNQQNENNPQQSQQTEPTPQNNEYTVGSQGAIDTPSQSAPQPPLGDGSQPPYLTENKLSYPNSAIVTPNTPREVDVSAQGLPGLPPVIEKKGKSKYVILALLLLAVVGVIGYFVYTMYINPAKKDTPVTSSDTSTAQVTTGDDMGLADVSVKTTSYLYPKGWAKINDDGASYGLQGGRENTWNAIVVVTEDAPDGSLVNASNSTYEQIRKTPSSNVVSEGIADRFLERTGEKCSSPATLTFSSDMFVSGDVVGLFVSEATCPTENGSATLKERTVVGKDGIKRYISILAVDDEWSKSADMFQKILNSVSRAT